MNKNRRTSHTQKHLTLSDRTYIEQELFQHSSFKSIAATLMKDPTTISKEVRKNAKAVDGKRFSGHCSTCLRRPTCDLCGTDSIMSDCPKSSRCKNICKRCYRVHPPLFCSLYLPFQCDKLQHAPYVCNSCPTEKSCPLQHPIYHAVTAQKAYEKTLEIGRAHV